MTTFAPTISDRTFPNMSSRARTSINPFLVGTIVIYACGVAWLAVVLSGFGKAITAGLLPFIIGDAIKLIAASLVLPAAWKLVK